MECQHWLPPLGEFLKLDIQRGDYLDGYTPGAFNVVLANPPFGKLWNCNDATQAFLDRIASQSPAGLRVAAILPAGYMESERPAVRVATIERFEIEQSKALPPGTFKPLTNCATEMVLLHVVRGAGPEPEVRAAPAVPETTGNRDRFQQVVWF